MFTKELLLPCCQMLLTVCVQLNSGVFAGGGGVGVLGVMRCSRDKCELLHKWAWKSSREIGTGSYFRKQSIFTITHDIWNRRGTMQMWYLRCTTGTWYFDAIHSVAGPIFVESPHQPHLKHEFLLLLPPVHRCMTQHSKGVSSFFCQFEHCCGRWMNAIGGWKHQFQRWTNLSIAN